MSLHVKEIVLKLIQRYFAGRRAKSGLKRYGDLDALAGVWTQDEAAEFASATQAFAEVDPRLIESSSTSNGVVHEAGARTPRCQ